MMREIYVCDRCGAWHTTNKARESSDAPYDPGARKVTLPGVNCGVSQDLCGKCATSLVEWFQSGKGAEVKPASLRKKR